jgi:hypothetical protein
LSRERKRVLRIQGPTRHPPTPDESKIQTPVTTQGCTLGERAALPRAGPGNEVDLRFSDAWSSGA